MKKQEKEQLEQSAQSLREAADQAHTKAAAADATDADKDAADEAEEAAVEAERLVQEAVVDGEDDDDDDELDEEDEDIDFEAEAKDLGLGDDDTPTPPVNGGKKPLTPLEKAQRSLRHNARIVKDLGGDPSKVLTDTPPVQPVIVPARRQGSEAITQDDLDLRDLKAELRRLAKTPAEYKVLEHHAEHSIKRTGDPMRDAENAYFIAHKGKIKRSFDELRRAGFSRPAIGAAPGRRVVQAKALVPLLNSDEMATMVRRGYKQLADGSWESKRYTMRFDSKKGWVSTKKTK